ncbi:endonuclease/exonuclease/phosphatase family protein [Flagellimonas sediminis]|uniref:Endonuclease n=1 Tax=Flagellimonas sediminis TaxID=2696468 RepID=A0A6I5L2X2_9FLAO|nr:endonuclease/exonuclease/phosphatase family protein [Allomuricauda sediminis]NDV44488.1 endonuclease [Allomuricauda sediminis]
MKNLSLFNKIIFLLNTLFALVLAISLLVPYVPTNYISFLSFLSLVVPISVLVNAVFVAYWLLKRKRIFLLSGSLLVLWYLFLGSFYKFSGQEKVDVKGEKDLSIMTFNARGFNLFKQMDGNNVDTLIYNFVTEKDPDIVCFQESLYALKRNKALSQYKYKFIDFIYGVHRGKVIQSIYSKHPIIKIDSISFPGSANNAIFADILFHKDTVRIYNVHLQSFRIIPGLNTIKNEESSKLFARLKKAMLKQYEQANLIKESMEKTPYKKILVGDFNNTQYSNVYQVIKGEMNDSYFEQGKGFGRTYDLLKFPIRIDYILSDPEFEVLSHQNFNERLSDHFPVMATLRLNSEQ